MTIEHQFDFNMISHFVVALEYGDYTVFDDEEELVEFERFLENNIPSNAIFQYSDESQFTYCDILDIKGDCITVSVYAETEQ